MKTILKNKIVIEGFVDDYSRYLRYVELLKESGITDLWKQDDNIWYSGKTSDIPSELAKNCVEKMSIFTPQFRAYDKTHSDYYDTAKESIQSACSLKYCLIYITK